MATINAQFKNSTDGSRLWVILDLGRDPNAPPEVYRGYLDPGGQTDPLALYSDGVYAKVSYQRSDGAPTIVDDITDSSIVSME